MLGLKLIEVRTDINTFSSTHICCMLTLPNLINKIVQGGIFFFYSVSMVDYSNVMIKMHIAVAEKHFWIGNDQVVILRLKCAISAGGDFFDQEYMFHRPGFKPTIYGSQTITKNNVYVTYCFIKKCGNHTFFSNIQKDFTLFS